MIRTVSGTAAAREIARLSQQVVANDRRIDLTAGQRAKAVTGLLELGVSVTKISKTVQMNRDTVKTAAAAGRSHTALVALDGGQLNLEQAAIVATFDAEGDHDAVNELLEEHHFRFNFTAKRLLADRAERKERAEAGQPYAERGFTVLRDEPEHGDGYLRADDLVTAGDAEVTDTVIEANPPAWAVWLNKNEQITLTETGKVIEDEQVDWSTQHDIEEKAEEGYHHFNDLTFTEVWVAEYFTTDPEAAGAKPGPILAATLAGPAEDAHQEREQARLKAEAAHKEAERAARRRTVALNKASEAATEVRKEWLIRFLARKTLPKGAAKWITDTLVDEPSLLTQNKAPQYLAKLLNVSVPAATGPNAGYPGQEDRTARTALATVIDKASDTRAQVLLLAQVLAAYEARTSGVGKDSWRRTRWGNQANYLSFLEQHGHVLTPVEQAAAGSITAEQAHDAHTEKETTGTE